MLKILFFCFLIFSSLTFANFPINNQKIPVDALLQNGMTEAKFNEIIAKFEKVYLPIAKEMHVELAVNRNWKDDTVNASASRFGNAGWYINMFGGMARHPLVTEDGFLLVICHEMGHHMGGFPKIGGLSGYWSSVEGQADYFGTLKCMKRILRDEDNISVVQSMEIDSFLKSKCVLKYSNLNEQALCERIGMASLSLAKLLSSLKDNATVAFNIPDLSKVKKTEKKHPGAQCRLDTYFAGIICDKSDGDFSSKDPTINACIKRDGYDMGPRPLCWYHPNDKEI